ncbi:hypothetical protein OROGR_032998 [Orobanche gracilis]
MRDATPKLMEKPYQKDQSLYPLMAFFLPFSVKLLEELRMNSKLLAWRTSRDTDEFSYLKVGIPRGKIFIINPKGEIVVNRHLDTKSYLSLHGLVHGMFPTTMSSSEQLKILILGITGNFHLLLTVEGRVIESACEQAGSFFKD